MTDAQDILAAAGVSLPEVDEYEAARREVRLASSGGSFLAYPPDVDGPLHEQVMTADAALVAVAKEVAKLTTEATVLLDACFQTVDPDDAEDIVQEAFPHGAPAWVTKWYGAHPNTEEADNE